MLGLLVRSGWMMLLRLWLAAEGCGKLLGCRRIDGSAMR
jgi:hypothetical protein